LLRQRCHNDRLPAEELSDYFRAHLNRGVVLLQGRVKSLSDITNLLPRAGG
jgi:hypothetical protein